MKQEKIMTVVRGPHTSEKTAMLADKEKQIVFKVLPSATKREIKQAVEVFFDVKVKSDTTVNVKGKVKRFAQRIGKRKDIKKAYVTLQEGCDISFATTE